MPIKTYTCSICRESTTKRKSYSVGNGQRACRFHSEATEIFEKNKKEKKEKAEKLKTKNRNTEKAQRNKKEASVAEMHCFFCGDKGVPEPEYQSILFFLVQNIGVTKDSDIDDYFSALLIKRNCLRRFPCSKANKHHRFLFAKIKSRNDKTVASLGQLFLSCDKCTKKLKITRKEPIFHDRDILNIVNAVPPVNPE